MTNAKPSNAALKLKACPHCGAAVAADQRTCWLCHAPTADFRDHDLGAQAGGEIIDATIVAKNSSGWLSEGFFAAILVIALVLFVLVGIGISIDDQGLLIPYLVVITPAVLATAAHSLVRLNRGKPVTALSIFLTLVISTSVTILVVVVLAVAAIIALILYCLSLLQK